MQQLAGQNPETENKKTMPATKLAPSTYLRQFKNVWQG
jgi:hypothetical protein